MRRSASLLGLELFVRSTPGDGSVFDIDIPLQLPDVPDASYDQLPGAFIAVIDADDSDCSSMEQLLRSAGCHVVPGRSGRAVRLVLAGLLRTPDLIVTSLQMEPGASGIDVIAAIRADAERQILALILTG